MTGTDAFVFGNLAVELACDACKRRNRAVDCRHMSGLIPEWKGTRILDLTKLLYGEPSGDQWVDGRLDVVCIESLENAPLWDCKDCKPTHIFISVDPTAGGSSHMAIVTIALIDNICVVSDIFSFFILPFFFEER